jgi:putative autoinducer-2 (AI-2) aldolase
MEDATRLNVSALPVQVFIGGDYETQSIKNMIDLVDLGNQYSCRGGQLRPDRQAETF